MRRALSGWLRWRRASPDRLHILCALARWVAWIRAAVPLCDGRGGAGVRRWDVHRRAAVGARGCSERQRVAACARQGARAGAHRRGRHDADAGGGAAQRRRGAPHVAERGAHARAAAAADGACADQLFLRQARGRGRCGGRGCAAEQHGGARAGDGAARRAAGRRGPRAGEQRDARRVPACAARALRRRVRGAGARRGRRRQLWRRRGAGGVPCAVRLGRGAQRAAAAAVPGLHAARLARGAQPGGAAGAAQARRGRRAGARGQRVRPGVHQDGHRGEGPAQPPAAVWHRARAAAGVEDGPPGHRGVLRRAAVLLPDHLPSAAGRPLRDHARGAQGGAACRGVRHARVCATHHAAAAR